MSSIDHVSEQETADTSAEQIAVDGSAGSDTDTAEPLKSGDPIGKDESHLPHHARSNSIKKPASFKAVSVTKNFLAKAGTPTLPSAKINGENVPSTATPGNNLPLAPRPRLVAKTASGSKTSAPKASHFGSRHGGSGPDPMQVWNRNRAAPQPAQKHFTDEELKQQYGIHLATRLQADADGKESKWADIDDDEDDWAPETIEWNDGTKITLAQNDTAALLAEEQARAIAEKARQEEEQKKKLAAQQKPTTTVGPNATVLKPRSAAQTKSGGLVLKTPSEKPTLVAKPSAPAPVRSPWASLPPVDKVSPVEINPPSQSSAPRTQVNEIHPNSTTMLPLPPQPAAMEIAADDFTRTRRDTQNGNLGQLYNAQSGQYEPAKPGRRGSVRKDQNFRPPSLLQRGSAYDQQGSTESSAAYQARRLSGQQDPAQWDRRGSSAINGDSGHQDRRTSTGKGSEISRLPHDALQQYRDSQQSHPEVFPPTPRLNQASLPQNDSFAAPPPVSAIQSPAAQNAQTIQEIRTRAESPYQSRNIATGALVREDVNAQKALMKEKRELAIQRKREEEEREEAAKKERIRKKMEELGLEPLEEKKESVKDPERKQIERRVEPIKVEEKEAQKPKTQAEIIRSPALSLAPASAPNQEKEESETSPQSPPKPPAPDASGIPQQYGMMKVHGAPSTNAQQTNDDRLVVEKIRSQGQNQRTPSPGLELSTGITESLPSSTVNGLAAQKYPDAPAHGISEAQSQTVPREPRQQPWNSASRDSNTYAGWNGQNIARDSPASNSVWGPPSHSRTLGNGTFDRGMEPRSRQQDQFTASTLAPIGPPRHLQRPREAFEVRAGDTSPVLAVEDFQTIPTFPPPDSHTPSTVRFDQSARPVGEEKRISPPQVNSGAQVRPQIDNLERPLHSIEQQELALASWGNFQATDAEQRRLRAQQIAIKEAEEAQIGIRKPEAQLPVMNETWKQVRIDDLSSQRRLVGVTREQNTHGRPFGPQINGDIRTPSFAGSANLPPVMAAGMGRGSRFFPGIGSGMHSQYPGVSRFPLGYHRSSSPPPPEDEVHSHPAYVRNARRPIVQIPPPQAEKIKVKLPPTIGPPLQSVPTAEVRASPLRVASQPLVNNPSWQDRFNGLLGVKKTSPEKSFADVVDFSATKIPLDVTAAQVSAAVSLPPQDEQTVSQILEPASKVVEDEETLFENREFGSLPVVNIPTIIPEVGWSSAKNSKKAQSRQSRSSKEVEAASKDIYLGEGIISNNLLVVLVRLGPESISKSLTMVPPKSEYSGLSRQRPVSSNQKPAKGYKPREASVNFGQSPKINVGPPPRTASHSSPLVQPRGQSNRNHPAWGPRTANAVH